MPLQRQRPGGKPGRSGTYLHRIAIHYLAKIDQAQDRLTRLAGAL